MPKAIWDAVKIKNPFRSSEGEYDLDSVGLKPYIKMRVTFEVLLASELSLRSLLEIPVGSA
jgi:hypothetical protein